MRYSDSLVGNKLTLPWQKIKKKNTKRSTIVHKTKYSNLKNEQHEAHTNKG